jgi:hypothetical protein
MWSISDVKGTLLRRTLTVIAVPILAVLAPVIALRPWAINVWEVWEECVDGLRNNWKRNP